MATSCSTATSGRRRARSATPSDAAVQHDPCICSSIRRCPTTQRSVGLVPSTPVRMRSVPASVGRRHAPGSAVPVADQRVAPPTTRPPRRRRERTPSRRTATRSRSGPAARRGAAVSSASRSNVRRTPSCRTADHVGTDGPYIVGPRCRDRFEDRADLLRSVTLGGCTTCRRRVRWTRSRWTRRRRAKPRRAAARSSRRTEVGASEGGTG